LEAGIRHSYQDLLGSLGIKPVRTAFQPALGKTDREPVLCDASQPA